MSVIASPSDQPLGGGQAAAGQNGQAGGVPLPQGRRRTELLMLAFVVGVVMLAYANVGLGLNGKVPAGMFVYGISFAVLVGVAHLAVRWLAPWADPLLLPLAALLNGLGIVMIYRLQEAGRNGNPGFIITTMSTRTTTFQVLYSAAGIAAFVAVLALVRQPRTLQRYTYTLGAIGLVLVALPAVLPNSISEVPGTFAKIQISLGGFTVQPEEFAKLCLAVFFAGYLVAKRDVLALAGRRVLGIDLPRARDLGPVLIAWGVSLVVLVFEGDIGTSALFFGLFVVMMYIATQRSSWLIIGFLLFAFGAFVASELFGHVKDRFLVWLHPFNYVHTIGFQTVQGLYGLGFGGVLGRGLGQGQPYNTPLVQSDFIITAFGEELGLTGLMALLLIYGLIVQRGLRAAIAVRDPFSKLLAGGLAFVVALQVFVIVGGVAADPADRDHHPVPVPGRLVADLQLDADRAADADQRHRAQTGPAADPGRGHDPGGAGRMNHALRRVSLIALVMFVLLLINVNYVQGFEASSLANEPGNGRTFTSTLQFQRGSIITADQKVIAYSKMNKAFGEYQRHYPNGKMYAPITGYDTLFSRTGIEQAANKELFGSDPALTVHNLVDLIGGSRKRCRVR